MNNVEVESMSCKLRLTPAPENERAWIEDSEQ